MPQKFLRRILDPFVLIFSVLVGLIYSYTAISLSDHRWVQGLLVIPFVFVWLVPVVYWHGQRESRQLGKIDHFVHVSCFLAMGWLNFIVILTLVRDVLLVVIPWSLSAFSSEGYKTAGMSLSPWSEILSEQGDFVVLLTGTFCWLLGTLKATRGPFLKEVDVEIPDLPPSLHHLRIAQISDLHIGTTIRKNYVEKVVAQTNSLHPDLVVLTGDMVDGSVVDLRDHALPLADLRSTYGTFMCLGNHDYYSGSEAWSQFWTNEVGVLVLRNEHVTFNLDRSLGQGSEAKGAAANLMVAGVIDPAARIEGRSEKPDPKKALQTPHPGLAQEISSHGPDFKLMLAHNPKLSGLVAACGFHLQLSGHTHAGQFLPWTWATKLIHSPHYAGLSREGPMLVYVNSGTGSWGPPLRFGTSTELTLLRLVPREG